MRRLATIFSAFYAENIWVMRRIYIYQYKDWPNFHWDQLKLAELLAAVRFRQGRLIGQMQALGFSLREEAMLHTLTQEVIKSSEIEGKCSIWIRFGPLLPAALELILPEVYQLTETWKASWK